MLFPVVLRLANRAGLARLGSVRYGVDRQGTVWYSRRWEKEVQDLSEADRAQLMVDKYGEVCKKSKAAKILDRSVNTINVMLRDGRLDEACGGTMVDVRSIARYITAPRAEDFEARKRRRVARTGCKWIV